MKLAVEWISLLRREFSGYSLVTFQKDLLAALTVAAVALPLALAFGVASGADAAAGLVTAVLAGLLIGFLGGSPHQVSGPTGAMAAVLVVLASRHGLAAVWTVGVIAGLVLVVLGVFRLGRVVSLIPAPVITGFTSGIAVIIALGQIDNALGIQSGPSASTIEKLWTYAKQGISADSRAGMITLVVIVTMLIFPRVKAFERIPSSLAGIVIATVATVATGWDIPAIGSIPRTILLENRLGLSDIPWGSLGELVVPAMSVAALGAIESLLCGAVAGNMTGIRLHNSVELVGQGIGNIIIPFFGGVPATAAIARTSVNIKSGGVTRMSPILHGLVLLLVALVFAPLISRVPLAALAGVLLVTAWRMNEWHSIQFYFGRRLKHAMAAFLITLMATVLLDLTQAIVIGFGISTLIFMSQISDLQLRRLPVDVDRLSEDGHHFVHPEYPISVYYLSGPVFFSSARKLVEAVEAEDSPGVTLILSMRAVPMMDATGILVLGELLQRQLQGGGNVLLAGLNSRVESLTRRSGLWQKFGDSRVFWSVDRAILSLSVALPQKPASKLEEPSLNETLVLTPHQDRAEQKI